MLLSAVLGALNDAILSQRAALVPHTGYLCPVWGTCTPCGALEDRQRGVVRHGIIDGQPQVVDIATREVLGRQVRLAVPLYLTLGEIVYMTPLKKR